jgi:MFS family permease
MAERSGMKSCMNSGQGIPEGFGPFLWHGFFLALTMAMVDLNTVLPSLVSSLTTNTVAFGAIYSVMLGAPVVFNLAFSKIQEASPSKRKYLLVGIYARSASFVGMGFSLLAWARSEPAMAYWAFLALVLVFSASGGFAGIAYSDIVGGTISPERRGGLYAYRQFLGGIASLIGGLLVARIFSPGSFPYPWNYATGLFIGAAGLIVGAFGFWRIRESRQPREEAAPDGGATPRESALGTLKRDKRLLRFVLIENLSGFSLMVLPFYLVFIQRSFTDYREHLGAFIIAQTIGSLGSNFLWSALARSLGPRLIVALCLGLGGTIPLLALALPPLGLLGFTLLFFLIGFVLSGRNIGFEPYFLEIAPEARRTRYLGIRGSSGILLAVLPLLGGIIIESFGFETTFIGVSAVMIAAVLLAVLSDYDRGIKPHSSRTYQGLR